MSKKSKQLSGPYLPQARESKRKRDKETPIEALIDRGVRYRNGLMKLGILDETVLDRLVSRYVAGSSLNRRFIKQIVTRKVNRV